MKKAFFFRLFAIASFCLASLVIKSETSSCKIRCRYAAQKAAVMQSLMINDVHESPMPQDGGFFIKI